MTTLTIDKNTSLKDLKKYCQEKGIEVIGNKSKKQSYLDSIENHSQEQSSIVPTETPIREVKYTDIVDPLPKVIDLGGQIDLFNKPKYVKTEVDQSHTEERLTTIHKLFKEFGSEFKFKVKVEKRHNYETFSENDLVQHLLWWFLVRSQNKPQSEVGRLWKTPQRDMFRDQLKQHHIVKRYLKILFP